MKPKGLDNSNNIDIRRNNTTYTLRNCIDTVINWNTQNMLLCNPRKTEVIQYTSRFVRHLILHHFSFGNTTIELSDKVRDLGVTLDKEL